MSIDRVRLYSLLLIFALLATFEIGDAGQSGSVKINYFAPEHLGQGQTINLIFVAQGASDVQSVEITPADGITIGAAVEEAQVSPRANSNRKRWAIPVTVAADAAPGKRSVVLVTSTGRSKPEEVKIVNHTPVISKPRVLEARSVGAKITFDFTVEDSAGDLGDKPKVVLELAPESSGSLKVVAKVKSVEAIDALHAVVHCEHGGYNSLQRGVGRNVLGLFVQDKAGSHSNTLALDFEFR